MDRAACLEARIQDLEAENYRLKEEINRLKGNKSQHQPSPLNEPYASDWHYLDRYR